MTIEEKYKKEVVPALCKKFGLKNTLSCPGISKIVVNTGVGKRTLKDSGKKEEIIKNISEDLKAITGQKPQERMAKKSVSGFSLRKGMIIGLRVTLRGKRMYQFLDKLINVVLPRVRDFQGVNVSSIDSDGNITVGIKEHLVFPEIAPEKAVEFFGMEITIVTTAKSKEEGEELLRHLGFPLKKING